MYPTIKAKLATGEGQITKPVSVIYLGVCGTNRSGLWVTIGICVLKMPELALILFVFVVWPCRLQLWGKFLGKVDKRHHGPGVPQKVQCLPIVWQRHYEGWLECGGPPVSSASNNTAL